MPSAVLTRLLRPLRGANLEVFKFGMYLLFPISWMYYFGTNLENRFSVPDFWPTQEQSHKIPFERDEIRAEVERIQNSIRVREETRRRETDRVLAEAREGFRRERGGEGNTTATAAAVGLEG